MNQRKHYNEIDVCRGMGIVLVVLGHALKQTEVENPAFQFLISVIYSFHMPLFFFLSGFVAVKILWLDQETERREFIKNRAFRLLIPYFFIGAVYIPLKYFLSAYAVSEYDFSQLWRIFLGENPNTALWYLYILFWVSVLGVWLLRERTLGFWLVISMAVSLLTYWADGDVRLAKYFFFFVFGIFARLHYEEFERYLRKKSFLILVSSIFVLANILYDLTQVSIFYFVTALSGVMISLAASKWICTRKNNGQRVLSFLGAYSMDIYILSEPMITVTKLLFWNILGWNYFVCTLLCFGVGILLPLPISKYVIRKVKCFRILLFGEK